jgi:hypothetical protein
MTVTSAAPSSVRPLREGLVPQAADVLAVTSRPGQESEDLGGVLYAIRQHSADLLLVIAHEVGTCGDVAVAAAACAAARKAGVPVVTSTALQTPGAWIIDLGPQADTARIIQKAAAAAHKSQSQELGSVIRRLDLLEGREAVRWLVFPLPMP